MTTDRQFSTCQISLERFFLSFHKNELFIWERERSFHSLEAFSDFVLSIGIFRHNRFVSLMKFSRLFRLSWIFCSWPWGGTVNAFIGRNQIRHITPGTVIDISVDLFMFTVSSSHKIKWEVIFSHAKMTSWKLKF